MLQVGPALERANKVHWNHHAVRGLIVTHFIQGLLSLPTICSVKGAIDILGVVCVVVHYAAHEREMTRAERESLNGLSAAVD